jgi:hypothetical protein
VPFDYFSFLTSPESNLCVFQEYIGSKQTKMSGNRPSPDQDAQRARERAEAEAKQIEDSLKEDRTVPGLGHVGFLTGVDLDEPVDPTRVPGNIPENNQQGCRGAGNR